METQIESFWVFSIASKCTHFTSQNTIFLLLLSFTAWLVTSLLYWTSPGGPAWGRYRYRRNTNSKAMTITGPRGFPVIGSMHLMASRLPHRKLAEAAKFFAAKRLMAFSIGETRTIMTCNPDVAKEILNSSVFSDRPVKESAYCLMFNRAIGFAPNGVYWRTLRRIAATHLFCRKKITASESLRFEIAAEMVSMIACRDGGFCARDLLKRASLKNMMCTVFGGEYEADEMRELVEEGYEVLGKMNWSDHLPWIAGFDVQKIRFRCSKLVPRVKRFVEKIIQEHREQTGERKHDFVDVLLSLEGDEKLSEDDMVAVLWEMIFRGTDTIAVLIEWILARMVLHPDIQSKVHDEINQVVGRSRPLIESDIQSTVYLQATIKEVLRLHPPGPLLSWARLATSDTTVDGHHVPAGTTAMVNMWAITRDPQFWEDPLKFKPKRFLYKDGADVEFSVLGSDLRLAPFGAGRRSCPGKMLGLSTVGFWVGTLLHEFEWVQLGRKPVDLSEVLRLSCEMATPLDVRVIPRGRDKRSNLNRSSQS